MKNEARQINEKSLLPFSAIKAASGGDVDAINEVLKHYESYMLQKSTRRMYDEFGQVHYCVDEYLRRILETRMIEMMLKFRLVYEPDHKAPFQS